MPPTHATRVAPVEAVAAAYRFCLRCPVRRQCAAEADTDRLFGGVYRWRRTSSRRYHRFPLLDGIEGAGAPGGEAA